MSEAVPVRGVLLGHGDMPHGMVDAVRRITGADPDVLQPLSNRGMSPESLAAEVEQRVGQGPAIIFTDLPSGSCGFVARRLTQAVPELAVVSGVNLPVLIEFVMNRNQPLRELVPRLLAKGRASIGCSPAGLDEDEHRAVSNR
jgi:mannose/fructose-specific phosphotransferase system component IIA